MITKEDKKYSRHFSCFDRWRHRSIVTPSRFERFSLLFSFFHFNCFIFVNKKKNHLESIKYDLNNWKVFFLKTLFILRNNQIRKNGGTSNICYSLARTISNLFWLDKFILHHRQNKAMKEKKRRPILIVFFFFL